MNRLSLGREFPAISRSDWEQQLAATIKNGGVEKLVSTTLDDIAIEPIYETPQNLFVSPLPINDLIEPWSIMQRVDIPDIEQANDQILDDLKGGASGLALVGQNSASANSYGLQLASSKDIKLLTQGVDLDLISVRLDAGRDSFSMARMLLDLYSSRKLDLSRCRLAFGIDMIADMAHTGTPVNLPNLSQIYTLATDAGMQDGIYCGDGRVYHGGGATPAQELGFTIASVIQQMRLLEEAGFTPDKTWPYFSMLLTSDADQFMSIAKLRAAHILSARLAQVLEVAPRPLQLHVETSMAMMSRNDPYVNMLRTTIASFAAGCGGISSLTVLPFTSCIGLPDGFARRMARNNQTILQGESSIGKVSDPAAGSGYVEELSLQLAAKAWEIMQAVEAEGGMIAALMDGHVQGQIADRATRRKDLINRRQIGLTGVSEFANIDEIPVTVLTDFKPLTPETEKPLCPVIPQQRLAEPFEKLRQIADTSPMRPLIFLKTIGRPADYSIRANWAENLFAAAGIKAVRGGDFASSGARLACICSSTPLCEEQGETIARQLKHEGAEKIYMTGKVATGEDEMRQAGVDTFLYAGMDIVKLLTGALAA